MNAEYQNPETLSNGMRWQLWRQDLHGNRFLMPESFATEADALLAQQDYESRGHHQTYYVEQVTDEASHQSIDPTYQLDVE